jgi:16S rRNA (uracil1498-N3)-methyltransferase
MKRILIEAIPAVGSTFAPPEEERHHLQDVRRVREGDALELLDGRGGLARATVVAVGRHSLSLEVTEHLNQQRESPLHLALVLAIPSQLSTVDDLLPGLVQLGLNRLTLVPTAWGGRLKKDGDKYLRRLQTIAANALKQCGRTQLPELDLADSWQALLKRERNQLELLFHPADQAPALPSQTQSVVLWIGPEGGFTPEEVAEAQAAGIQTRGFGPRILKLETAALATTAWAQSQWGDGN